MKLSTCAILLAVVAVTFAAPYGNNDFGKKVKKIIPTTTLPADVPEHDEEQSYGGYNVETTTIADIPTTTFGGYETTLEDEPILTTRRPSYGQRTTTLMDLPTTKKAYGGYNVETTTLADIPTTKASYGYQKKTTTLADIPTTKKAYGGYKVETTTLMDLPTTKKAYGGYQTTTIRDVPVTTTRRSYGQRTTTPLADIPTTKASYGYQKKTTTLADIPTTKAYGGYKKTTTLEEPTTTVAAYNYNGDVEQIELDEPVMTTTTRLPHHHRRMHKTTLPADFPINDGGYNVETTTLMDLPTTEAYGGYETTLEDEPVFTTTRRPHHRRMHKTTLPADFPINEAAYSYNGEDQQIELDEPVTTTTRRPHHQRRMHKPATLPADVPVNEEAYGGYNVETTTLMDIPTTTFGSYETTLEDEPVFTTRRASYGQRTTTFADLPIELPTELPTTRSSYNKFVKPERNPPMIKRGGY